MTATGQNLMAADAWYNASGLRSSVEMLSPVAYENLKAVAHHNPSVGSSRGRSPGASSTT